MKPRLTVLTLGVDDLDRALRFYRDGLGLPTEGIVGREFEHGAVAFFELQPGLRLALWPRRSIAHDAGVSIGPRSATEVTLGWNVASRGAVDAAMERARAAGASIVKPAQRAFWGGYAGYFEDPDAHLWEVVWNPGPCREATPADADAVLEVHRRAFGREDEAALVGELLRDESARPLVSVVAEQDGEVVGHGLFSAVRLADGDPGAALSILAPLAVLPEQQGAGVGTRLIELGCELLARRGAELVFVLGDPRYYGRRGFEPALRHGLHAPYPIVPAEAWRVRALVPGVLGRLRGTVVCARSMQAERYWRE